MFSFISKLLNSGSRSTKQTLAMASRLACDPLEDRTTPTASSISANFNGVAIPAGDYIWFTSEATVSGLGKNPVTVDVTDQTISFTAKGTKYTLDVPDSTITFNPATKLASTSFGADGWSVSSPSKFDGSEFLSGLSWQAPKALPDRKSVV